MSKASKQMVLGSMVAAGLVAVAALVDMVAGFPFAGSMVFDIIFLIAAGLVIYLGWDAYQDVK
ncbi:MAG: hypothetical protein WD066_07405 [Planctomycetaceae bacterium]